MTNLKQSELVGPIDSNDIGVVDQELAPDIFVDNVPGACVVNGIIRMNFETIVNRLVGSEVIPVRKLVATIKITPEAANGMMIALQQIAMAVQPAANAGKPHS